jgi:hypothetical protein
MVINLLPTLKDILNDKDIGRVICFGTGRFAERYLADTPQFAKRVAFFIDSNAKASSVVYNGITYTVKPLDVYKTEITDRDLILVTSATRYLTEALGQLVRENLPDTVSCHSAAVLEFNDGRDVLDTNINTVCDFIALKEISALAQVDCGNALENAQYCAHISEQLQTLTKTAREIYSEYLKKSDPELFSLLDNAHDMLCDSVKTCDFLFMMNTAFTYHHGCSANSMGVLNMLKKKGSVFSVSYASLVLHPVVWPENIEDFNSENFRLKWEYSNKKLVQRITECKHIIFSAETLLDVFNPSCMNFYYMLYYAKTILGKKVSVINHSLSPVGFVNQWPENNPCLFTDTLKLLCPTFDNHYVRESISFRELNEFLPGSVKQAFDCSAIYVADMYAYYKKPPKKRDYVLISGGNNLPEWYPEFIYEFLRKSDFKFGAMPVYYLYSDVSYAYRCENGLYERLAEKIDGIALLSVKSTENWLKAIQGAALFISGRYHHSISAFMLDTPFLSFKTDTRKMAGMLELLEKTDVLLPSDDMDSALTCALTQARSVEFTRPNNLQTKERLVNLAKRNVEFL